MAGPTLRDVVLSCADGPVIFTQPDDLIRIIEEKFLVIPKADLPEMDEVRSDGIMRFHQQYADAPPEGEVLDADEHARNVALHILAALEHRRTQPWVPPVDERQVERLAAMIREEATPPRDEPFEDLARRLIARGDIIVKVEG